MREILYRGKSKDNGEWAYGCLAKLGKTSFSDADRFGICNKAVPVGSGVVYNLKITEVDPETVGQYTGLKDKNGAKIFEGDIVKYYGICKPIIGVVKICEEDFSGLYGVCETFTDGSGTSLLKAKIDCQVVGNIYDTPELLKQGNDDCIYADFNKKAEV